MSLRVGFACDGNDSGIKYKCGLVHMGLTFRIIIFWPCYRKLHMAETHSLQNLQKEVKFPVCSKKWPIYEDVINYNDFFHQNCSFVIILRMVFLLVSE